MLHRQKSIVAAAALLLSAGAAQAGSYFNLTATGSSGTTVTVPGSNLLNLTNNLIKTQDGFYPLVGQSYTASLTYGGVPRAVQFASNATGTRVTVTVPSTGFSKTFTGPNAGSVESQIRKFLEHNGADQLARLEGSIDRLSYISLDDGNPQAATAFFATEAFDRFGLQQTFAMDQASAGNFSEFGLDVSGGSFTTPDGNGAYATLDPTFGWRFSNNVGLEISVPFEFLDQENAYSYILGMEVGMPITIINAPTSQPGPNQSPQPAQGLSWQITPWGIGGTAGSEDQVAGGVMAGGGGTDSLNYQIDDFTFTAANEIAYEQGIPVNAYSYHFNTDVAQLIMKNGGKVTYCPGGGSFFVDAGVAYTDLFHRAAVPDYWSPMAGLGWKFNADSGIRVGYSGDFAHNYHNNGGQVMLYLAF
ncbi:MAG TPA: hypothetical protein VMD30_00960 [Tepidisphaeraceae bacterium]|nr:hypothetical protein [Tepidisphaeraceae bacterium]